MKLEGPQIEAIRFPVGWNGLELAPEMMNLLRLCLLASDETVRAEALMDVLASAQIVHLPSTGQPPAWLRQLREEICECPELLLVGEAAARLGVHRSYLTALFRHHYGLPPSLYRQRVLVSRAVAALASGKQPLSGVAVESGFCDQPHMTRCVAAHVGLTPSMLRRMFNDIRSRTDQRALLS